MFKFSKKISSKFLLISISILNFLILVSLVFYLLLGSGLLDSIYYLIAFPIDYLSNNYLVMISLLLAEILVIIYGWYKNKNNSLQNEEPSEELTLNTEMDFSEFESDFNISDQIGNDLLASDQNVLDNEDMVMDNVIDSVFASLESSNQNDNILPQNETEDYDLSPSHFSSLDNSSKNNDDSLIIDRNLNTNVIEVEDTQNKKSGINDYQYAFYQNIVNDGWLYEKSCDRERVGFERHALDEAKITLSDIENLISTGMLYKQIIHHPTGAFVVYSSRLDIEKFIIKETIRRIIRKKRLRFVGRKFDFVNWQEFGLAKKIWEFDLEITEPQIVGSIWINDAFLASDSKSENSALTQEKKDELKAIIAATTLKMKDEGNAIIITNSKENSKIVKKFAKKAGWGTISAISFSDSNFEKKFTKLIEENI